MIHIYPYKRFIWVYTPFRGAYDIYLLKKICVYPYQRYMFYYTFEINDVIVL